MSSSGTSLERASDLAIKPHGWGAPAGRQNGLNILKPLTSVGIPTKGIYQTSSIYAHDTSKSYFTTLQTYQKICEWFNSWQPWQQKMLLCGITNRCATIQLESLATSLEPVFHRDFIASLWKHYPLTASNENKMKNEKTNVDHSQQNNNNKEISRLSLSSTNPINDNHKNVDGSKLDMERKHNYINENKILDQFAEDFANKIIMNALANYKLMMKSDNSDSLENIGAESVDLLKSLVNSDIDVLGNIVTSNVEASVANLSKNDSAEVELFGQPQSSNMQLDEAQPVGRPRSNNNISTEERLLKPAESQDDITPINNPLEMIGEENEKSILTVDNQLLNEAEGARDDMDSQCPPPPVSVRTLSSIIRRKSQLVKIENNLKERLRMIINVPLVHHHLTIGKRVSLLNCMAPDDVEYLHRDFSASHISQQLRSQDFFPKRSEKLGPMQAELRTGQVKKPSAVDDIYVPLQRMYKNNKWWTGSQKGRILLKPNKNQLKLQFKRQINQIWQWMAAWQDHENLSLLSELIKLCDPELINYFTRCLAKKLQEKLNINWLSDKLLLLVLSYLNVDDIYVCSRVCRRWRYLCAIDDLWVLKCKEFGLEVGIPDIVEMVHKGNKKNEIIDWKLAYLELQRITNEALQALPIPRRLEFEGPTPDGKVRVGGKFLQQQDEDEESTTTLPTLVLHSNSSNKSGSKETSQYMSGLISPGLLAKLAARQTRPDSDNLVRLELKEPNVMNEVGIGSNIGMQGEPGSLKTSQAGLSTRQTMRSTRQSMHSTAALGSRAGSRKKKSDDSGEVAVDIRPELRQAKDLVGNISPPLDPAWHFETTAEARMKLDQFAGSVRAIKRVRKLQGHMDSVLCVEFDKRRLISGSMDRTIRIWDIRSGRSIHKLYAHKGGVTCLQFDNDILFSGSWDMTIMAWDLVTFTRKAVLYGHRGSLSGLKMHNDIVVSCSHDGTVKVWGKYTLTCQRTIKVYNCAILSMVFDGFHLLVSAMDKTMKLINFRTDICVRHFQGDVHDPADNITAQGHLIITGNKKGVIEFWDREKGEMEAAIQAHDSAIQCVVYHGGHFFTASSDSSIKEWDLLTMACVRQLQGHKGPVTDLKVSDNCLISCSTDGHIRIWDMNSPALKLDQEESDNIKMDIVDHRH